MLRSTSKDQLLPTVSTFAVYRHYGGSSCAPLKPLRDECSESTIVSEEFKGGIRGNPIMPRDAVSRTANVGTVGMNGLRKKATYPAVLPWSGATKVPSKQIIGQHWRWTRSCAAPLVGTPPAAPKGVKPDTKILHHIVNMYAHYIASAIFPCYKCYVTPPAAPKAMWDMNNDSTR